MTLEREGFSFFLEKKRLKSVIVYNIRTKKHQAWAGSVPFLHPRVDSISVVGDLGIWCRSLIIIWWVTFSPLCFSSCKCFWKCLKNQILPEEVKKLQNKLGSVKLQFFIIFFFHCATHSATKKKFEDAVLSPWRQELLLFFLLYFIFFLFVHQAEDLETQNGDETSDNTTVRNKTSNKEMRRGEG